MAMVHQRKDEMTNQNEGEENSQVSEKSDEETKTSRCSSRNSSHSKRSSPVFMPQYQYSKDELMDIAKLPLSQARPACLDPMHNNSSGKWDPENWFLGKRGDKVVAPEETRLKRVRTEEAPLGHKKRTSDPRERIKEEKDEIILSPQRRSFGTGCHVIQHSSFTKRPGSPTDLRDGDSYRERRIGSGRIVNRDRDQRDWEREHREYNYNAGRGDRRERFDQDDNEKDSKRYSNRYGRDRRLRDRIDEEEPEWFSGGPTSQSETIELVGFDEPCSENENKRTKKSKKNRESARRQSLKSEDEEKPEPAPVQDKAEKAKPVPEKENAQPEVKTVKRSSPDPLSNGEGKKQSNVGFDLEDLLRMDWIPGLLQNESPQSDTVNTEIGGSRFSQWFSRSSPVDNQGSESNSRRSSFHEELLSHVLSGIGDPGLMVHSPTPVCSEPYFAPISPAMQHAPACTIMPPHPVNNAGSKNFLEMLKMGNENGPANGDSTQSSNNAMFSTDASSNEKNIKEMEADLKRLVLGNPQARHPQEDLSAFDKLMQHMSDATPSSISIGPLDKSKVLQEEDLLQNMLGQPAQASQAAHDKNIISNSGNVASHVQQQQATNDLYSKLFDPRQQHQLELQQQQQQQAKQQQMFQNQSSKQGINPQGLTVDMLAKILDAQSHGPLSPASPGGHPPGALPFGRNEPQSLNAMLQQQRQREMMSSVLKQQQQQQQQMSQRSQNASLSHLLKCSTMKDVMGSSASQTLGLPATLPPGVSPRQSPLPPDAALHTQGRIPSPLIFGQQPPALSHAPAPIHPNHLAQAMAPNPANSNTLQVQNAMVLQRVPSPQELAVHTQTILQNALIKRKLEEQKENFRKRQEAQQRTISPVVPKSGNSSSPLKGLSPTIAFTPTSVMRKMHSEKPDAANLKNEALQNGAAKPPVSIESRTLESLQNSLKPGVPVSMSSIDNFFANSLRAEAGHQYTRNGTAAVPRPVYGQCSLNPNRPIGISAGVTSNPVQGRPIVKGGNNQIGPAGDASRPSQALNKPMMSSKMFPASNSQYSDREAASDAVTKFLEQQRLLQQQQQQQQQQKSMSMLNQQRRQNTSPMPSVHNAAAAASFGFAPRAGHAISAPANNMVRPVNIPLLRTMMQANPGVRTAQGCSLNQMSTLGQLAALQQLQRACTDNRPMLAARNYHPLAFQQQLLNSLSPVAVQAQAGGSTMIGAHGDGKHAHLVPGQNSATNRQSPVNLTKWFGNDVLKQKMPEMPPVSHQKALLVEEVERQQQPSTIVHN